MNNSLTIEAVSNIPTIKPGDNLAAIILAALCQNNQGLDDGDILCVASKIVSIAENRFVDLRAIQVSDRARSLHRQIPRKDPSILQLIIDQTNDAEHDLRVNGSWLGAKNLGRILTSGGVDKVDDDTAILLPTDPDASAGQIGEAVNSHFGHAVGIIITDSDGREGIAGATQLCVGLYGVPPIRRQNNTEETACDMLAAAAGLVMGQRGHGIPAVIIRGYRFEFDSQARLGDGL